jgi:hypothetical protein
VPQQHLRELRWNHANDRVTQVLSPVLELHMDPAHSVALAARFAVQPHDDSYMAALPDDILPNIFSRLPAPEVFALSAVSKQFLRCSRPAIRDWAMRELAATTEGPFGEQHWKVLLDVMRNGLSHIGPEEWQAWLQAAESKDQTESKDPNIVLIQMARLAPCVSGEVDSLVLVASSAGHRLGKDALRKLEWLATGSRSTPWMGEVSVAIISGTLLQLIQIEREREEPNRHIPPACKGVWKRIIGCFPRLSLPNQIQVLAQVAPTGKDSWYVGSGLHTIWHGHINAMRNGGQTPWPPAILKPARTANYFRMLKREIPYGELERVRSIEHLLCVWLEPPSCTAPWREQPPELTECLLRAAAVGQGWPLRHDLLCKYMISSGFVTHAEMTDFSNYVFNRGWWESDPVCEWIADNREQPVKIMSCSIS